MLLYFPLLLLRKDTGVIIVGFMRLSLPQLINGGKPRMVNAWT